MNPRKAPDIDALFSAPLDRFITERDQAAKELATAGDDDAAKAVKALRKPSVTAWTLNQMARTETELLEKLFATGEHMRRALAAGEHAAAREAQAERRAGLKEAGAGARRILDAAGHASSAQVEKVRSILLQATTDEDLAKTILEGRLSKEPEAEALTDVFGGAVDTPEVEAPASTSQRVDKLERRVEELREEAETAAERAAHLAREADSARLAADAAADAASAAERAAERALRHLEKAESDLKDATR